MNLNLTGEETSLFSPVDLRHRSSRTNVSADDKRIRVSGAGTGESCSAVVSAKRDEKKPRTGEERGENRRRRAADQYLVRAAGCWTRCVAVPSVAAVSTCTGGDVSGVVCSDDDGCGGTGPAAPDGVQISAECRLSVTDLYRCGLVLWHRHLSNLKHAIGRIRFRIVFRASRTYCPRHRATVVVVLGIPRTWSPRFEITDRSGLLSVAFKREIVSVKRSVGSRQYGLVRNDV